VSKLNLSSILLLVGVLVPVLTHADDAKVIGGANTINFNGWEPFHRGWKSIEYQGVDGSFRLYDFPDLIASERQGIIGSSQNSMVAPDKKYLLIERTEYGVVDDGDGSETNSEQTHCDLVSLATGCVEYSGTAEECDGSWQGGQWIVRGVGPLDTSNGTPAPSKLNEESKKISDAPGRKNLLKNVMYMGVNSYMACYPPGRSVSDYNDIGYYFAQGGDNKTALKIYKNLLTIAPDRIPLQLNAADSMWALGDKNEAKELYGIYKGLMLSKGLVVKIPARVNDRLR
jgi:hypothetical protein